MRKSGKGTLAVISLLLIGSATLRVAIGATQALAKSEPIAEAGTVESPPPSLAAAQACETPDNYAALLKAFGKKSTELQQREAKLETWQQILEDADVQISERLSQLEQAETGLRATISIAESAAEDDLTNLVVVYEAMKPKDAAALFEEMDPVFAAGFLGRMAPDRAAGVLTGMTPQSAYSISVILAGRNANAPTQ